MTIQAHNPQAYVVFAIDNNKDLHTVAKFTRHMDTQKALGNLKGNLVQAIGYWEGTLEPSYIMSQEDYEQYAWPYAKNQECVLVVPADTRQPSHVADATSLKHLSDVGVCKHVSPDEAMAAPAWTYVMSDNRYFVCQ